MGRNPFLTTVAWGRSIWSAPEENDWDTSTQRAIPTTSLGEQVLPGRHQENLQLYDGNLRPINPKAQQEARERRIAANNILSIIGVVEQTRQQDVVKTVEKERAETLYIVPVVFATRAALMATSQWIVNLSVRLLATPNRVEQSLYQLIKEDYSILGPVQFFFGGIPAILAEIFVKPSWLAPMSCYWTIRAILANVISLETRNSLVSLTPVIYKIYYSSFEILSFPFRLNVTLQQLGLVQKLNFVPDKRLLQSIRDSLYPIGNIPGPLIAAFLYGPLAHFVSKHYVKPRVVSALDGVFDMFEDDVARAVTTTKNLPDPLEPTEQSDTARTAVDEVASHSRIRRSSRDPRNDNEAQSGLPSVVTNSRMTTILSFDEESSMASSGTRGDSQAPDDAPGNLIQAPARLLRTESTHDSRSQEEERLHQIRIAGRENADGTIIEELNISFYDRITDNPTNSQIMRKNRTSALRRTRRHDLPLSDTPQRILEALITAHITTVLLQPLDSWFLPRLAQWWIERNDAVGPIGKQGQMMSSVLGDSFPDPTAASILRSAFSKAGKIMLCFAIREVMMGGVWAAQTQAVVWLGRWRLGWTRIANSSDEGPP